MTKFAGWMGDTAGFDEAFVELRSAFDEQPMSEHRLGAISTLLAQDGWVSEHDNCLLVSLDRSLASEQQKRALVDAYRQHGVAFLARQDASHSMLLIDVATQTLLMTTDAIGLCNIYYAQTGSGIVFGSRADFVVKHPGVSDQIDHQSVYDYVYYHHCPSPNTIYRQVKKMEGGQYLLFKDGKVTVLRYWLPAFQEDSGLSWRQAGQELRDLLTDSVKSVVDSPDNTGAFLSGGLDSSSVAGALAQVFPGKAKTFSMGFPVDGYNEIEYANLAVKHFNTRQHEYYVTPQDTVNAVPLIAKYYDEPFGNSSALAAYYCAKLAKEHGVSLLLAGDGGDEIFAGNERYAKQMLFEHYRRLPGVARSALEFGLNGLPRAVANQKLPFKVKRYIDQANTAMPDRLQDYNYLLRHNVADIFQDDFLTKVDVAEPLQLLRDCYNRPENASTLNRMLYMDWKTTLHDNDLVKVNRMCELAGVEVAYPLLDQRIVDLSCRVASDDKLKGQKLRWFYKQAMAGFLPEAIINKPKHGFGLPFGIWLKDHQPLKEMAYDAINGLKKREFFKPEFLDHSIEMHQSIHAAYYGELIWVLMMLEMWFVGKSR